MSDFGVYQAYRRMLREEQGPNAGEYVLLYICGGTITSDRSFVGAML